MTIFSPVMSGYGTTASRRSGQHVCEVDGARAGARPPGSADRRRRRLPDRDRPDLRGPRRSASPVVSDALADGVPHSGAMRAITVIPGKQGSVALSEMPEPPARDGPVLVQTQAVGVCGTDLEIINGDYGSAPPGEDRLSSGTSRWAGWCRAHRARVRPRGSRRGHRAPPRSRAVPGMRRRGLGHVHQRQVHRAGDQGPSRLRLRAVPHPPRVPGGRGPRPRRPRRVARTGHRRRQGLGPHREDRPQVDLGAKTVLVTGAGPIGLLAALLSVQRGYDTYVVDLVTEGASPRWSAGWARPTRTAGN